jgi:molybdopterin molybdotransferase
VAFFSTGDELVSFGTPLGPGQLYDSNRYSIHALLDRIGAEPIDMGVVADDPAAIERAFRQASEIADVVITSGGVSVGEADFVKQILNQLGEVLFWKIAMKPGRPLAYGKLGKAHFFGLPGNPVSAIVTFHLFVRTALRALQGLDPLPPRFTVHLTEDVRRNPRREQAVRVTLASEPDGRTLATTTGPQNSHLLTSVVGADALAFVAPGDDPLPAGSTAEAERL